MAEGMTCYERDEALCEDGMCLRCGCRLRNNRLSAQQREPVVRVKGLEWQNCIPRAWFAQTDILTYRIYETTDGAMWFLEGGPERLHAGTLDEAKAAAQADYEQRIMAAIEIIPAAQGLTASEAHDGGSPGPSPLAVMISASDPASGRSQPSPGVSVDELAQFLRDADRQTGNCTDDDSAASYMDLARALLANYRIERLDRLASSGRRG